MDKYVAKHYTNIAGRMYTPGEIITEPIPDDELPRLLRIKAIAPIFDPVAAGHVEDDSDDDSDNDENTQQEELQDEATPDSTQDQKESVVDDDECDETAEAPEINILDGIVPPAEEPPVKEADKKPTKGGKKA